MKKIVGVAIVILLLLGFVAGWNIFGPTVNNERDDFLYVKSGTDYTGLLQQLQNEKFISGSFFFNILARRTSLPKKVYPGKYKIDDVSSLYNLIRKLKSGRQEPVNFTITKLRTIRDLAGRIGKYFETDSATAYRFIKNPANYSSIGLDTNTIMTAVIPNTYTMKWTDSLSKIIKRLYSESETFWNSKRTAQLSTKNISKKQAYIIASIVEEESNSTKDKPLIASVYLNRLNKGMRLEADPSVKFAMQQFGIKRIMYSHLKYPSAYNTYINAGLPPGPICTPQIKTIDAVLTAPATDYIFFVASPQLDGTSRFANNYALHQRYAKEYQDSLTAFLNRKKLKSTQP